MVPNNREFLLSGRAAYAPAARPTPVFRDIPSSRGKLDRATALPLEHPIPPDENCSGNLAGSKSPSVKGQTAAPDATDKCARLRQCRNRIGRDPIQVLCRRVDLIVERRGRKVDEFFDVIGAPQGEFGQQNPSLADKRHMDEKPRPLRPAVRGNFNDRLRRFGVDIADHSGPFAVASIIATLGRKRRANCQ